MSDRRIETLAVHAGQAVVQPVLASAALTNVWIP